MTLHGVYRIDRWLEYGALVCFLLQVLEMVVADNMLHGILPSISVCGHNVQSASEVYKPLGLRKTLSFQAIYECIQANSC